MRSSTTAVLTAVIYAITLSKCEDKEDYKGKHLGKINSYHHQVSGDVYAVDEYTLLFINFNYDGNGADTFFWAGAANRPGPQGFIVPDEYGHTNVLARYFNKDFTLTLPDKKKITEIKWFAVYDLSSQNTFGDIYIPEDFEPPATQKLSELSNLAHNVSSESIEIIDAKRIRVPEFKYDGLGKDTFFWVGLGPLPSSKGIKVPDEYGYLDPIRAYKGEDIILQLPGETTIFDIDWFSIFDVESKENYGSIWIPDELNVPPSLVKVVPYKNTLPNCLQLHKDLQVGWEIFGPQITIQLAGQVAENEYMAFGLSGSNEKSQMIGADVTVAFLDGHLGYAQDYNITAKAPCGKVLGQYKGVCKDGLLGGEDNNQLHTATREDGINTVTYRRSLISSDHGDKTYPLEGSSFVIWAIGRLNSNKEPMFHDFYPKGNIKIELNRKEKESNCFQFTRSQDNIREPWKKVSLNENSVRTYTATIGPSGGRRGYQGITNMTSPGLSWYINGYLAPELTLRRGLYYTFHVYGGNNPHSAEHYHPFIITDEPHGGFERLSEEAQKRVRVLAGVEFNRRGQPKATTTGPLCISKHNGNDRRLDDDFPTFKKFNRTLIYTCDKGEPGILQIQPNKTWPDEVYYNSYTHNNMGWKIRIVDSNSQSSGSNFSCNLFFIIFTCTFASYFR